MLSHFAIHISGKNRNFVAGMESIALRQAKTDDLQRLQEISRDAFVETFSVWNTEANMKKYLDEFFSFDRLQAELCDGNSRFYFAEIGDKVAGYLKLNAGSSQTELKTAESLEIERIYVLKAFQGRQLGRLLFTKALDIARQEKAVFIWLGVWEENAKAIAFYKKNGLVEFDRHIFKLGDDEQTDIMMRVYL